jgi:urease accessory protein
MNVAGIVQLCQSSYPENYFAALGLATVVASPGRPRTAQDLAALVESALHNAIGPTDGIAAGIAFRATRVGDLAALPEVAHTLSRLPGNTRHASLQMGHRLWGLSRHWPWALPVHQQVDPLTSPATLHHALAFGTLASETTSSQVRAIATCLFNIARNIILAACRAIPLPEAEGERVLSGIQPSITQLATRCADKGPADIVILP